MAYASSNYTEIKTRIIIRNDTSENWEGSTIVLEKGEPAIEYDATAKTAKLKFGDGVSKFSELPFSTLTPSEVDDLINAIDAGGAQVTTVTTSGDGNAVTGGSISADGTTLTLTKGQEFVPASGGTFTGDITAPGISTTTGIRTTGYSSSEPYHTVSLPGAIFRENNRNYKSGDPDDGPLISISSPINIMGTDIKFITTKDSDGDDVIGSLTISTPTDDYHAATKKYVDDSVSGIVSAVDAMKFKGTIGTSGTVVDITSISSPSTGDTYKIITATSLTSEQSFDGAAHDLTVGDLVVYASNKWVFVPSGNEDVTTVKVADTGDTINVSTTAQTGAVVLGTAAGVNTASTVTDSSTTVPTSSAVKTYVDTLENSLGTAATTDATAYATADQGTLADNAMPKSGGTFTGAVTLSGTPTIDLHAATKKYVDDSVSSITVDSLTNGTKTLILNGGSATE